MSEPTLLVRDLHLFFKGYSGLVEVLHGISLHINRGERVALVGESGSGKSVTARIILGLLQMTSTARIRGQVVFEGLDFATLSPSQHRSLRGTRMSMVFQDPTSSLNPVYPISEQFHEVLKRGMPGITRADADRRAAGLLSDCSIADPERVLASYTFQLSAG